MYIRTKSCVWLLQLEEKEVMSFLDKLWDETLAGPTPETGLSKLRKYNSFNKAITRSTPMVEAEQLPVTRSITIARTQSSLTRSFSSDPNSLPDSPSVLATPRIPLTPKTPADDVKKLNRTKSSDEAQSLNIHHWMVINGSLDR